MSPNSNSQIYSLWNIYPTASRFTHRNGLSFMHRSGPNRSVQTDPILRPLLSLYLNTPRQAQLDVLLESPSESSLCLHALLALLVMSSSAFDASGPTLLDPFTDRDRSWVLVGMHAQIGIGHGSRSGRTHGRKSVVTHGSVTGRSRLIVHGP